MNKLIEKSPKLLLRQNARRPQTFADSLEFDQSHPIAF